MKSKPVSPFLLYELSVQSPQWQVDYLPQFHKWLIKKEMRSMREDFCGSGQIACEWVKRSPKNSAVGLDIDPATLKYANQVNKGALNKDQQSRVKFLKHNVLKPTKQKFDFIGAYNFSYFIFHTRKEMLAYAKAAHRSLNSTGTFFLEVAGGKGFLKTGQEKQILKVPGIGRVEQIWEQHQFDPITSVNDYSIHFKLPDGKWLSDAFTYHWRIWQIQELRDILADAGFKKSIVLWESRDEKGKPSSEYLPTESAENLNSWVAYVVGVK